MGLHRRQSSVAAAASGAAVTPSKSHPPRRHTVHAIKYTPQSRVLEIRSKWEQRTHAKRESEAIFLTKIDLKNEKKRHQKLKKQQEKRLKEQQKKEVKQQKQQKQLGRQQAQLTNVQHPALASVQRSHTLAGVLSASPKGKGAAAVRKRWAKRQDSHRKLAHESSMRHLRLEEERKQDAERVAEAARDRAARHARDLAMPAATVTSVLVPASEAKAVGVADAAAAVSSAEASAPAPAACADSAPAGDSNAALPDGMNFTEEELLGLRLLFSILDRQCSNFITLAELCAYGQETGVPYAALRCCPLPLPVAPVPACTAYPLSRTLLLFLLLLLLKLLCCVAGDYALQQDAKTCMDVVDADGDGQIGFADYLQLAARLKAVHDIQVHAVKLDDLQEELLTRSAKVAVRALDDA